MIEVNGISKSYPQSEEKVIDNLSFSISEGEKFGLLGPNGAGKTTLISILSGILSFDTGQISILQKEIPQEFKKIQAKIGVVPQEVALYPTLTAWENLHFFGAMYGLPKNEISTRVTFWLDKFDMLYAAKKQISNFSGGMKRRINLIAALLHSPQLLFLDEPTVGIDVQSRLAIMAELETLNQQGMTIIYTSHHLEEAQNFCSKVAIMDKGKFLAQGSSQELINSTPKAEDLEDVFIHLTKRKLRN